MKESLEECIVTVLWPFLSEMSLCNRLLLHRIEPQQNMFQNSALLICNYPAAQQHPQQLYKWTGGKRETVLSKNVLLPRKSKSPLSMGFILLAAVWWQMPHLVSRLEWKCHHSLSSFKTFSNCLKSPSPADFPPPAPQN